LDTTRDITLLSSEEIAHAVGVFVDCHLLPFVVVVSVTLSDMRVRIKIWEVLGQYGQGGSCKSCQDY
jgi:hypothetical protein